MFQDILLTFRAQLERLHKDQGGAVALMCLAACLILLMLGLVLYDTGKATREKLQLETAADTAAYTQAGIKARTMNMIAFTNITKRSIVTLQNVYVAAWAAYEAWYISLFPRCFKIFPSPSACRDIVTNALTYGKEGAIDWRKLSGIIFIPTVLKSGGGAKKYQEELAQLTKYQKYITKLTPWWAYMSGMSAGTRNGASLVGSFPHPPDPLNGALNFIDTVVTFIRGTGLYPQTSHKGDYMPVASANSVFTTCLDASVLGVTQDALYGVEYFFHIAEQARYSNKKAPQFAGTWLATGPVHCAQGHQQTGFLSFLNFALGPMKAADSSAFKYNAGAGGRNTGERNWALSNSNVIVAYSHKPANFKEERARYNFLKKDYDNSLTRFEKSSGFWAMSSAEYVFLNGSVTPWHTSWTARMAPIAGRSSGMTRSRYSFNAMYHDMLPYMGIGILLGILTGMDIGVAFNDLLYFEKASRAMDPGSLSGIYR
jgi:hypothetical protein